jgi:hypothetical protein
MSQVLKRTQELETGIMATQGHPSEAEVRTPDIPGKARSYSYGRRKLCSSGQPG